MKSDLEQRRDLLTAMESNLAKAMHWNDQISESFHKCDVDLSKYSDLASQLSDRWRRIQTQIDNRYGRTVHIQYAHICSLSLKIFPYPLFVTGSNNTDHIITPSCSSHSFLPQSVGLGEAGDTAEKLPADQYFLGTVDGQCQETPGYPSDG